MTWFTIPLFTLIPPPIFNYKIHEHTEECMKYICTVIRINNKMKAYKLSTR